MVGATRGRPPTGGSLKVVTTGMKLGYVRWNGVPYSEDAVITEHYDRYEAFGDTWLTITTIIEDPKYYNQPFITSADFKLEKDRSKWKPTPCVTDAAAAVDNRRPSITSASERSGADARVDRLDELVRRSGAVRRAPARVVVERRLRGFHLRERLAAISSTPRSRSRMIVSMSR